MDLKVQIGKLQAKYPDLHLVNSPYVSNIEIKGKLILDAEYNSRRLIDEYHLRLLVPISFPNALPRAYDLSQKVSPHFEHFLHDGAFCLGTETDMLFKLQKKPTLVYFVDEFLMSYLYASSFFNRYGVVPFSERPHGLSGIYDFYKEHFSVTSNSQVLTWLTAIMLYQHEKTILCPCGSDKGIEKCTHRNFFMLMTDVQFKCYENDMKFLRCF